MSTSRLWLGICSVSLEFWDACRILLPAGANYGYHTLTTAKYYEETTKDCAPSYSDFDSLLVLLSELKVATADPPCGQPVNAQDTISIVFIPSK